MNFLKSKMLWLLPIFCLLSCLLFADSPNDNPEQPNPIPCSRTTQCCSGQLSEKLLEVKKGGKYKPTGITVGKEVCNVSEHDDSDHTKEENHVVTYDPSEISLDKAGIFHIKVTCKTKGCSIASGTLTVKPIAYGDWTPKPEAPVEELLPERHMCSLGSDDDYWYELKEASKYNYGVGLNNAIIDVETATVPNTASEESYSTRAEIINTASICSEIKAEAESFTPFKLSASVSSSISVSISSSVTQTSTVKYGGYDDRYHRKIIFQAKKIVWPVYVTKNKRTGEIIRKSSKTYTAWSSKKASFDSFKLPINK
ncbi:MAG: hypothetical protein ACRC37_08220 [Lentisphaeria bacterium]